MLTKTMNLDFLCFHHDRLDLIRFKMCIRFTKCGQQLACKKCPVWKYVKAKIKSSLFLLIDNNIWSVI